MKDCVETKGPDHKLGGLIYEAGPESVPFARLALTRLVYSTRKVWRDGGAWNSGVRHYPGKPSLRRQATGWWYDPA